MASFKFEVIYLNALLFPSAAGVVCLCFKQSSARRCRWALRKRAGGAKSRLASHLLSAAELAPTFPCSHSLHYPRQQQALTTGAASACPPLGAPGLAVLSWLSWGDPSGTGGLEVHPCLQGCCGEGTGVPWTSTASPGSTASSVPEAGSTPHKLKPHLPGLSPVG